MKNKKKPVAFITGVTGQDGAYLANLLLCKGYDVFGGFRRGATNKTWRLDFLGITKCIKLLEFQLNEPQHLIEILKKIQPNEIYHLAGESMVADSFKYPSVTLESNTIGTLNILEAVRIISPKSKIFFASSSEIFGKNSHNKLLNESSLTQPNNPYAISKLTANYFVKLYRDKYDIFACSGILFNHESPLRGLQFVTRKITYRMAQLKMNSMVSPIELGDLNSSRDWGSAIDYVKAMKLMLETDEPKDYIIATGVLSSVRDCLRLSAFNAGFDPIFEGNGVGEVCVDNISGRVIAKVLERNFRKSDTLPLAGDPTKIELATGWVRAINFEKLIEEMSVADMNRIKAGNYD